MAPASLDFRPCQAAPTTVICRKLWALVWEPYLVLVGFRAKEKQKTCKGGHFGFTMVLASFVVRMRDISLEFQQLKGDWRWGDP